jgi:hypothetical protein
MYYHAAGANPVGALTQTALFDNLGNLSLPIGGLTTGTSFAGGWPIAGDLNVRRGGSTTGYVFVGDTNHYYGYDGTNLQVLGNAVVQGTLTLTGSFQVNTSRGANAGSIYLNTSAGSGSDVQIFAENGALYFWPHSATPQYYFQASTNAGWGPLTASAFTVASARKFKTDVRTLSDPLRILADERLHGVRYTDIATGQPGVGVVADDWLAVLPEIVKLDERGDVLAFDYDRLGAVTFEALKLYVEQTDPRLAALEARCQELEARLAA